MIEIKPATEADLPEMLAIYNHIILHTTAVWQYNPHTIEMRQEWFKTKQEQGFPVFVAKENDVVVGFSTIGTFRAWEGYKNTVENSVYVSADARGKGIGKALLEVLITAAKEMKLHAIVAGIDGENELSIDLHKKFGFVHVAHFKEVGFKCDRWLDLIFMELIIADKAPLN